MEHVSCEINFFIFDLNALRGQQFRLLQNTQFVASNLAVRPYNAMAWYFYKMGISGESVRNRPITTRSA